MLHTKLDLTISSPQLICDEYFNLVINMRPLDISVPLSRHVQQPLPELAPPPPCGQAGAQHLLEQRFRESLSKTLYIQRSLLEKTHYMSFLMYLDITQLKINLILIFPCHLRIAFTDFSFFSSGPLKEYI